MLNKANMKQQFMKILKGIKNNHLEDNLNKLKEFTCLFRDEFTPYADKYFLDFVGQLDVRLYILDSSGDDFEMMSKSYIKRLDSSNTKVVDIWRTVESLIWELCVFCTDIVCPRCKSDTLKIVQDLDNHIYKVCDTCFYSETEEGAVSTPICIIPVPILDSKYKNLCN